MRALVVTPGHAASLRLVDRADPEPRENQVLLRTLALGICGSDQEIVHHSVGRLPEGSTDLVLGHEAVAQVVTAPADSGLRNGQLVVPTVRRACTCPSCLPCRSGRSDLCWSGQYRERGILELDGFGCDLFTEEPEHLVPVPDANIGLLLEPASVLAKALDQVWRVADARGPWQPRGALVLGAGPVGLLGALFLRQNGLETTVYDRADRGSPKACWAERIGAHYVQAGSELPVAVADHAPFSLVLECTGATSLVLGAALLLRASGVLCLLAGCTANDVQPSIARRISGHLILTNGMILGSVNSGLPHFLDARRRLSDADKSWPGLLDALINERLPLARFASAFHPDPGRIKVALDFCSPD